MNYSSQLISLVGIWGKWLTLVSRAFLLVLASKCAVDSGSSVRGEAPRVTLRADLGPVKG